MKSFVNIIVCIGFLFFGGGFLIAFGQFVIYNGFGQYFTYIKADNPRIEYEITDSDKMETMNIYYSYTVDGKLYESKETIATSALERRKRPIDEIYYNKLFPSLSYVGANYLKIRQANVNMAVTGFFFLFILVLYKSADMDKWIRIYTRHEYKKSE